MDYIFQIANAASGSIWENFDYADDDRSRDMGLVLDAMVHDMCLLAVIRDPRGAANAFVGALLKLILQQWTLPQT